MVICQNIQVQNRCLLKPRFSFYEQHMYRWNSCLTGMLYIHTGMHTKQNITEVCQLEDSGASIWQMFIPCAAHQTIAGKNRISTEYQGM